MKRGPSLTCPALACGVLIWLGASEPSAAADPIPVLLIDGQNNHAWQKTTPVLVEILEESGRFEVTVSTTPPSPPRAPRRRGKKTAEEKEEFARALEEWRAEVKKVEKANEEKWAAWRPDFAAHEVVVSNYNGKLWPEPVRKSFEQYVEGGGGFVVVHAANNAFPEWRAYNRMIGLGGWGGRSELSGPYLRLRDGEWVRDPSPGRGGSHGRRHEFLVETQAPEHPVMDGLPSEWMHAEDELYDSLRGPARQITVLAAAHSSEDTGGSGEHEPLLMTVTYGEGRIFHTALGHDTTAMSSVGFQETLKRGAEWAATGEVTFPDLSKKKLPADEPAIREVSAGEE